MWYDIFVDPSGTQDPTYHDDERVWSSLWPHSFDFDWPHKALTGLTLCQITGKTKRPEVRELQDWLNNFVSAWSIRGAQIGFSNENDAFAFKMRWL